MNVEEKLINLRDSARHNGDSSSVIVLNGVIDDIQKARRKAQEVAKARKKTCDFNDVDVQRVIKKAVEARRELGEAAGKGGREDYMSKMMLEANLIESVLPKALSYEDMVALVEAAIMREEEQNGSLQGKKQGIGLIMKHFKSRADVDNKVVSQIIREKLGV